MRNRFAIALVAGAAGIASAHAADLSSGQNVGISGSYYSSYGVRMDPVIVYDFEPGVIVRCYWCPPWGNRHYFPMTGRRPKVGRLEHLPKRRIAKPEEFYRFWSVSSVFGPQLPATQDDAASQ